MIIDGPNAVIGTLPDETALLVMDQKKLRPATVGGRDGVWGIASEICGVEAMIPDRDASLDFQPMREHTVIIPPHRKELDNMVSVRSVSVTPSSLIPADLQWIIEHREDRCTLCGNCTTVCPKGAIRLAHMRQRLPKLDVFSKKRGSEYRVFTGIRQETDPGQTLYRLRDVRDGLPQRGHYPGSRDQRKPDDLFRKPQG